MKLLLFVTFCLIIGAQAQVRWRTAGSDVPVDAIAAGTENGRRVWVCRAMANGGLHGGKHRFMTTGCFTTANGREVLIRNYEFATGFQFSWFSSNINTAIPANAVQVGFDSANQRTFSCRGTVDGNLISGRLQSNRQCFLPYAGIEYLLNHNYQILLNP